MAAASASLGGSASMGAVRKGQGAVGDAPMGRRGRPAAGGLAAALPAATPRRLAPLTSTAAQMAMGWGQGSQAVKIEPAVAMGAHPLLQPGDWHGSNRQQVRAAVARPAPRRRAWHSLGAHACVHTELPPPPAAAAALRACRSGRSGRRGGAC